MKKNVLIISRDIYNELIEIQPFNMYIYMFVPIC